MFHSGTTRRDFLHVGYVGGIGLTLDHFLRAKSAQADIQDFESKEGTAKSVIFIYLPGGCAHQETWDPKPYAPVEYRGPMNSIETSMPGVFINEMMPQTAQIANKLTICRSMSHGEAAHERGTHNMFTGYRPSPALEFPSMGSVVTHEFPPRNNLPQYVCIPSQPNQNAGTGYLSSSFAPFSLGADPANGNFTVQDLKLPGDVDDQPRLFLFDDPAKVSLNVEAGEVADAHRAINEDLNGKGCLHQQAGTPWLWSRLQRLCGQMCRQVE